MEPNCYVNRAGRSSSSLLCCKGLKWEMPATVNKISFSAVNLTGSSAVPVDDSKIAESKKFGSLHVCLVKFSTCDHRLIWDRLLRLCTLQRFFTPHSPSSLFFPLLILKNLWSRKFQILVFGSEQCRKSRASGSSGEVEVVC